MRPQRLTDPIADTELAMDERLGFQTRRDIATNVQDSTRSRAKLGIEIFSGDSLIGRAVKRIIFTGAGADVVAAGETVTVTVGAGGGGTMIVQEGGSTVDGAADTIDFDGTDFNVSSSPAGEANVSLNYGTGAGQPAEGDHTHAGITLTVEEGGATVETPVDTINFDSTDFNVSNPAGGYVGITLSYADTANHPAEGDHIHGTLEYIVTHPDYGALGDGSTDDSTAFNDAITAANTAGGGIVSVPEGTYIVQNVTLKSNVILRGVGYGSILKLKNSTTADVIKSAGTSAGTKITFAGVENLTVDGNKANQSNGVTLQQFGVALQFATDCWVDRCWVKNTQRGAIYFSGSRNRANYNHCTGIGKVGAASDIIGRSGIVADSDGTNDPTETDFSHNRVIDCLEHGIKIYPGGHGSQVTHNIINAAEDRGIYVQGANRVRVIGNEVNGASTTGIFMGDSGDAGADCVVDDNTINGILIGDSGGDGILVWNHSNVKVTNNTVTNCERHGIQIYDSSVANVCGNNCDTNGQNGGGAGIAYYQSPYGTCSNNICTDNDSWGIYLRDGAGSACTHIVLSGNYCDDLGSGDQDYGILSDNDSNYLTLAGNDLSGNVVSAYSLVGSNNTIVAASHTQITLGPFYLNDVQGTAGPQVMSLGYFNTATAVSQDTANLLKVPAACKAVALLVVSDSDWTAGTADVYISVNGAAGTSINGNLVRLSTTNRETHYYATTHDSGLAFTAGQTIQLQVDTTGWTPTTANFTAWVTISLD